MANKNDEFIKAYNDLDSCLRDYYDDGNEEIKSPIMTRINELNRSSSNKVKERGRMLNLSRLFRNSLVHELDMNQDNIVEINDSIINFLKKEKEYIVKPIRAIDIATKRENLLSAKLTDKVIDIMPKMYQKSNLQVPILDQNNRLLGILSPNSLFLYQIEVDNLTTFTTVNDVLEYTKINKHISENYAFTSRRTRLEDISNLFDDYYNKGKKLAMVFVTENGKNSEALLGIITPYDVIKAKR